MLIAPQHWDAWLDRTQRDPAALPALVLPADPGRLQAWPVSQVVNRSSSEGEALVSRLPPAAG